MGLRIIPLSLVAAAVLGTIADDSLEPDTKVLKPVPSGCLRDFTDPKYNEDECLPLFWNHMIVSAATPKITEELRKLKKSVSDATYYEVDLYDVVSSDKGTTFTNVLRVLPLRKFLKCTGFALSLTSPPQDQSADAPQFDVTVTLEPPSIIEGRGSEGDTISSSSRKLRSGIKGSEKISFQMANPGTVNLTRSYYRHLPPEGVEIKGILIQYHGWLETCEFFENKFHNAAIADKYGLILISACGSGYGWFSTRLYAVHAWNAGVCCTSNQNIDDLEYTRIIIQRENKANLPVYGYGYSNGGMLVESLLCHKIIQGAVSVNGVLALQPGLTKAFKVCDNIYNDTTVVPKPPAPRMASVHCIDDGVVPYNGSVYGHSTLHYIVGTLFPRTNRDVNRWAKRIDCGPKQVTKTRLNKWTVVKEWECQGKKRVVSIKRFNCSYYILAHGVVKTFDLDPADWAANFFLSEG